MSPEAMVTVLGGMVTIGWIALRVERVLLRREQNRLTPPEPKQKPWTEPARPSPPAPRLDTSEQAALASLALRYAHGDTTAGRRLADYLRTRLPAVPDTEIARCLLALRSVTAYYIRVTATEAEALGACLDAIGAAALDLTALERQDIPR